MFVVNFVGSSYASRIPVVRISEHFESLVNKYIMHHKVSYAIGKNTKSDGQSGPEAVVLPAYETYNAHGGIKDKEDIIPLPPTSMVLLMMVPVQAP
jgi:hypothetical protein